MNQSETETGDNEPWGGQEPGDHTPDLQAGRLAVLFKSDVIPIVVSKLDCWTRKKIFFPFWKKLKGSFLIFRFWSCSQNFLLSAFVYIF